MTPDLKGERRKIIFHLPFEIDKTRFSASQIRPLKMLDAFKKIGYDVFEVMGNTKNRKKRCEHLKESFSRGAVYDFCYSESSTMPTLLTDNNLPNAPLLEINFFSLLQKNKVPIGIFYRDIYWKFNFYKKSVGFLKSTFATFFYNLDLWMYKKFASALFLPTLSMAKYLPENLSDRSIALPSGCEITDKNIRGGEPKGNKSNLTFIYVGGVMPPHYHMQPLFDVAKKYKDFIFKIICRPEEWVKVRGIYAIGDNIKIIHASGEKLKQEYDDSDIFLNIREPDEYLHFSMPMKIFEALQEGKPIITSDLHEIAGLISSNELGWVINSTDEFINILSAIEKDRSLLDKVKDNIEEFIKHNTWISRAEEVKRNLLNENFNSNRR